MTECRLYWLPEYYLSIALCYVSWTVHEHVSMESVVLQSTRKYSVLDINYHNHMSFIYIYIYLKTIYHHIPANFPDYFLNHINIRNRQLTMADATPDIDIYSQ